MRWWLVGVMFGGCGFRSETPGTQPIDAAKSDDTTLLADAPADAVATDGALPTLCNPSNASLRACFTFDGHTQDGSQYNHHANASGTTFGSGHAGQGLVISAGDLVNVAASTNLDVSQLTIDVWIRPTTIPIGTARGGIVDSGNRFRLFLHPGGVIRCRTTNGPDLYTTTANAVPANAWTRVTCTYDGTTMRIFVAGTLAATQVLSAAIPSGAGMVIGHNNPSGENFEGTLDDLRIFDAIVVP